MEKLTRSTAGLLVLLLLNGAWASVPTLPDVTRLKQEDGQPSTAASLRALQDEAAALSDAAADDAAAGNPSMALSPDYAPLPQGPEMTADKLVQAIVRMAKTFESPIDMLPAHVAEVAALGLVPDSEGRRTGLRGPIGPAHYEFVTWKSYRRDPGEIVELSVRPSATCTLQFKSLHDPLVDAGFTITKGPPGFKPLVFFERALPGGLGLYVTLIADDHRAPRCVSRVTLEMEQRGD